MSRSLELLFPESEPAQGILDDEHLFIIDCCVHNHEVKL
jgi:hypothetical protein